MQLKELKHIVRINSLIFTAILLCVTILISFVLIILYKTIELKGYINDSIILEFNDFLCFFDNGKHKKTNDALFINLEN